MTAILLVGGRSSRMGRPKALLPFDGEPLAVHLVRRLRERFQDVVVVAAAGQELPALDARVVRDQFFAKGPIAGLHAGLVAANDDGCFLASCDLPFLNVALAAYLVERLAGSDAVVPLHQGRLQPLHAAYARKIAARVRERIARGELRMTDLAGALRTQVVDEDTLRSVASPDLTFRNLNVPADYAAALGTWPTKK